MKEENFIMLPKFNKGYSNEEMFLLALSQALVNKLGYVSLTFGDLINYCGVSKANQNLIVEALQELQEKKHLKVTFNGENKNSIILIEEIKPKLEGEKSFIQIYIWELSVFLKEVSKSKIISMFTQFAFIMGFINRNEQMRQIAYPTLHLICQAIGKSERTIRNYNEELEKLKLLYSNNLVIDNETVKKVYSRFSDRLDVDEAIAEAVRDGNKRISLQRTSTEKAIPKKENVKQASSNVEGNILNSVMKRVERCGLDFNKPLSKRINEIILNLKDSKADAVEVIVCVIEKTFRDAASTNIKSKNAFLMNSLKDIKNIKKAEDYVLRQKAANERPIKAVIVEDHYESYAKMEKLREEEEKLKESKKPKDQSKGITSLSDIWGVIIPDDDDEQAS